MELDLLEPRGKIILKTVKITYLWNLKQLKNFLPNEIDEGTKEDKISDGFRVLFPQRTKIGPNPSPLKEIVPGEDTVV